MNPASLFRTFLDTDGRTFLKASSKFCLLTLMSETEPEECAGPVWNNDDTFKTHLTRSRQTNHSSAVTRSHGNRHGYQRKQPGNAGT